MSLTEADRDVIRASADLPPAPPPPVPPRRAAPTAYLVLPADAPREQWLARRREGIGSSDIPPILGVDSYGRNPRHVYFDKVGGIRDEDDSEAALWGLVLEEPVAREWTRRNRTTTRRVGIVAHQIWPWAICTLDRRVGPCPVDRTVSGRCALEVKTRSAWLAGRWRQGIPDDVHGQLVWQMMVTGYDHIHLAVLIGGQDYRQYTIRRDLELESRVLDIARDLWAAVQARRPPELGDHFRPDRELELEERRYPHRQDAVPITADALASLVSYQSLGQQIADLKVQREIAKTRMIAELGGHLAAELDGETAYVYGEVFRRTADLERLAELWPDAYADVVTEKTGHALQVKSMFRTEEA